MTAPESERWLASPPTASDGESRTEAVELCRSAIEASLTGVVDVQALLDGGLLASRGELDPRVILEPDGSDHLRFPIRGLPEHMTAEFRVAPGIPDAPLILGLRLEFEAPRRPYMLEAAIRARPEVLLSVFLDSSGGVQRFDLMTKVLLDHRETGRALGVDWTRGTLLEGMLGSYVFGENPFFKAKNHGLVEGNPRAWDYDGQILGAPSQEGLRTLGDRLLTMYRQVNREEEKQ